MLPVARVHKLLKRFPVSLSASLQGREPLLMFAMLLSVRLSDSVYVVVVVVVVSQVP